MRAGKRPISAFYINEDRLTRSATVHQAGGPCQVPQRKRARDGQWHGPFRRKEGALRVAREVGRDVHECQRCNP
ncbi:MAG: hypothetical protein OXC94_06940 [Chloroflexi bacterium]|nr:hypothetical protein [Chloroflexota bacterium]